LIPLLLLLAVGVFLVWWLWPSHQALTNPDVAPRAVTPRGELGEDEEATIKLFKAASPSVVHILTTLAPRRDFFSLNQQLVPRGTGSGFVWSRDDRRSKEGYGGYVVTNVHVVEGATAAAVPLA